MPQPKTQPARPPVYSKNGTQMGANGNSHKSGGQS